MTYFVTVPSAIGDLTLTGDGEALTGLYFSTGPKARTADPVWLPDKGTLAGAVTQLHAYFAGELRMFDLPLRPRATHRKRRSSNRYNSCAAHTARRSGQAFETTRQLCTFTATAKSSRHREWSSRPT